MQDWKELTRSLFSALKLEKIAMFLVLGIVILVASFSIVGNLIMVVVEKGREIALLKTLGASDFGVMQVFAIQGLMIGLLGTVLGVGVGLCGVLGRASGFGLPLDPDVYYIDSRLPIHIDPSSVLASAARRHRDQHRRDAVYPALCSPASGPRRLACGTQKRTSGFGLRAPAGARADSRSCAAAIEPLIRWPRPGPQAT